MQYIDETLQELAEARKRYSSVIVSFSGGKDSIVVMDLCRRTFPKVEAFFMEFVPGLSMSDEIVRMAKDRWGITCRRYLHWVTVNCLAAGTYCDNHWRREIRKMTLADVYTQVRRDTGMSLIATGAKRADGIWRRRVMASTKDTGAVVNPLAGWQKAHVLAYLKLNKIPVPDSEGSNANGVDLTVPSLLWLHDTRPDDFRAVSRVFPYVGAVVARRRFHGIGAKEEPRAEEEPSPSP